MTLTEFLLARLAEDEETAHSAQRAAAEFEAAYPGYRTLGVPYFWDLSYTNGGREPGDPSKSSPVLHVFSSTANPARALADIAAKRRIVEEAHRAAAADHYEMGPLSDLADHVLVQLALPYAGHPDYRGEWKP